MAPWFLFLIMVRCGGHSRDAGEDGNLTLAGKSVFTRRTTDDAKHGVLLKNGAGGKDSFTNKVLGKHELSISEFEFQFNSLSGFLGMWNACRAIFDEWYPCRAILDEWWYLAFSFAFSIAVICRMVVTRLSRGSNFVKVRIWKRRSARRRICVRRRWKAVVFAIFVEQCSMVQAMNQEQFSALMGELVNESWTSPIVRRVQSLEAASRILKNPEYFDGEGSAWAIWRHGFLNWITYADAFLGNAIEQVEQQDPGADVALDTDEARALSVRLYAVLTSYLRGSALQLSRSMSSSKNGLQLWESAGESVRTGDKAEIACNFLDNSNVPWFYARQDFCRINRRIGTAGK